MSQFDEYYAQSQAQAAQDRAFKVGSGGIASARQPQPPQPMSARISQALALAENVADQLSKIADSVMGSEPTLNNALNQATATLDPTLTHKIDHLMQALSRINRQADRLNSAF